MHEMSIAMSIVGLAEEQAKSNGASKINGIEIEVGELGGVMIDSLEFCFEAACRNTLAAGAKLKIERISAEGECLQCQARFPMDEKIYLCPKCNESFIRIVKGDELKVKAIDVD